MNLTSRILVSGTYFSGSSAVTDFLSEFDGVLRIPGEFDDFRRIGLVGDSLIYPPVPYPLRFNEYISRNRSHSFVSNVFGGAGGAGGRRGSIHRTVDLLLDALLTLRGLKKNNRRGLDALEEYAKKITSVGSFQEKLILAKEWLSEVERLNCDGEKFQYTLFDQPIFHGQHQNIWPRVFDPYKLIIVIRNPLDQLAQLIGNRNYFLDHSTCLTHGIHEIYGADSTGMINYQLAALGGRYRSILKSIEIIPANKILIIPFEELVNQYSRYTEKLLRFVTEKKMDLEHSRPMEFFDPKISCKNIGIAKYFESDLANVDEKTMSQAMELHKKLSDVSML